MSKHQDSIAEHAQDLLVCGEEIVSALVVSPRGSNTAVVGGLAAGEIGRRWSDNHRNAAANLGLIVKRNSGLALTNRRLLTIWLTGGVKAVNGVLSELALEDVDEVDSKWNVIAISAGGSRFKLECKPPAAKAFARAFAEAKAGGAT
jgi:hypothetical protein